MRSGPVGGVGLSRLLCACLVLVFAPAACPALVLVNDGQPRVAIVLREAPDQYEKQAAEELCQYLQRISGAELPICTAAQLPKGLRPLFVGVCDPASELERICQAHTGRTGFALEVRATGARLAGFTPESTLFAAYELLEQLGVRWFMPGELGTVIPQATTVALADREAVQVQTTSFEGRWHNGGSYFKEWGKHVRMGGPYFPSSHGIPIGRENTFDKHPEYYALRDGQRQPTQLCVSNPEVIRLATEQVRAYFRAHPDEPWMGLGPDDGSGFCQCDNCRAVDGGDWDPFSNEPAMTDRYVWFFNQVLKGLADEYPDKKLCFYAYHTYMRPPVKVTPDPRLVPALAAIALCRLHGPDSPVCPEKSYWVWLAREWRKTVPQVYDRGYWFNLADPGFPFSELHRLRLEIPLGKQLGLAGWRVETANHWGSETPTLYVAAKLMWDANADVDALLGDFCARFFGPASGPMRQYLDLMDAALHDGDYHTGCSWDLPLLYPAALRDRAARLLGQAAHAASPGVCRERVKLYQTSFDYLQAFVRMSEYRDRLQFARAADELAKLRECQKALLAYDPPMLNPRMAEPYLKRFFAPCVEQGGARTSGGNRMIAPLAAEWEFQLDPQRVGEDIGLWREDCRGGNWQRLRTDRSWSDQGLRTYKGEAWYRQTVSVSPGEAGRRLCLWFGGVDEKAKVWLNGRLVGESNVAAFVPFEFDVTSAAETGPNVVVVKVTNNQVDELGTGGLTAPVMLYAPSGGR